MCTVYSHLVSLPAGVLSADREGAVGEVGLSHNLFDLVHGWDPLRWGAEQLVGQLDCGELEFMHVTLFGCKKFGPSKDM